MQRIAIIGEGPAALSTAEKLISAGMCVDLITQCTAPFGLLRRFAGLAGVLGDAVTGSHCVAVTTWEGLCAPLQDFEDWRSVITRAQLAHVGI